MVHSRCPSPKSACTEPQSLQLQEPTGGDNREAVLATLVQLAQHDAGRGALVSAGVPAMAAQWLSVSMADGVRAASPAVTLQLLRLVRNLCAAGSAAADPLTAGGVPTQLARMILEHDSTAAGDSVPARCGQMLVCHLEAMQELDDLATRPLEL